MFIRNYERIITQGNYFVVSDITKIENITEATNRDNQVSKHCIYHADVLINAYRNAINQYHITNNLCLYAEYF